MGSFAIGLVTKLTDGELVEVMVKHQACGSTQDSTANAGILSSEAIPSMKRS